MTQTVLTPEPFKASHLDDIPRRQFIGDVAFQVGQLALTIAPGGVGKSSLCLAEAVTLAAGEYFLTGKRVSAKVWLINTDDDEHEMRRRLSAVLRNHFITAEQIEGKLYINSTDRSNLQIVSEKDGKVALLVNNISNIIKNIKKNGINLVIVDPFVSSHGVSENDNMKIDIVAKAWIKIAREANCAVHIVHHSRKEDGGKFDANSSRGASSLHDAARYMRVLSKLDKSSFNSTEFAEDANIVKIDVKKSNYSKTNSSYFFQIIDTKIDNGDSVGVAINTNGDVTSKSNSNKSNLKSLSNIRGARSPYYTKSSISPPTDAELNSIITIANSGDFYKDPRHKKWLGKFVAIQMNKDIKYDKDWLIRAINECINRNLLVETQRVGTGLKTFVLKSPT